MECRGYSGCVPGLAQVRAFMDGRSNGRCTPMCQKKRTLQIQCVNGQRSLPLADDMTVYQVRMYVAADFQVYPLQVDLLHVGPDGSTTPLEKEDVLLEKLAGSGSSCTVAASARRIDTIVELIMRAVSNSQLPGMAQRNTMELATSLLSDTLRSYTSAMIKEAANTRCVTETAARAMSSSLVSGELSMEAIRLAIIDASHGERPFRALTETYAKLVTAVVARVLKIAPSMESNRVHAEELRHGNDQGYACTACNMSAPGAKRRNADPYRFHGAISEPLGHSGPHRLSSTQKGSFSCEGSRTRLPPLGKD